MKTNSRRDSYQIKMKLNNNLIIQKDDFKVRNSLKDKNIQYLTRK